MKLTDGHSIHVPCPPCKLTFHMCTCTIRWTPLQLAGGGATANVKHVSRMCWNTYSAATNMRVRWNDQQVQCHELNQFKSFDSLTVEPTAAFTCSFTPSVSNVCEHGVCGQFPDVCFCVCSGSFCTLTSIWFSWYRPEFTRESGRGWRFICFCSCMLLEKKRRQGVVVATWPM